MENTQVPLFVEDLNEAIRATVNCLGGFKAVGVELKPEKSAVDAGKWLADCLNSAKRDRLDPEQLAYIRRRARAAGCHVLAAFEMQQAGYAPPVAIAPADEAAELKRQFIESTKMQALIVQRLERLGMHA
ncbi:hypothetical protein [Pseudoxanthomonas sacheonensis]|uniref:hypothetical protein n=1 Tax=Pseudoxanthomonas sacheonensis TaxID=443615 RepID=UPI0013D5C393|nr:hypothetical protein [Pseudoxanthomonas sacheonensis]KAF1706262.1 hypothetical protein CSC73_16275 [Pseudoxanthomonas sacheonensis]